MEKMVQRMEKKMEKMEKMLEKMEEDIKTVEKMDKMLENMEKKRANLLLLPAPVPVASGVSTSTPATGAVRSIAEEEEEKKDLEQTRRALKELQDEFSAYQHERLLSEQVERANHEASLHKLRSKSLMLQESWKKKEDSMKNYISLLKTHISNQRKVIEKDSKVLSNEVQIKQEP